MAGLSPAYLAALQFTEHAESAALSRELHAAANNGRAWARAQSALQQLVAHPERAERLLPAAGAAARSGGGCAAGRRATVQLLLMGAIAGGIDAKAAPLQLKPAAGLDSAAAADLAWLRRQQVLYARKAQLADSALASGGSSDGESGADGGGAAAANASAPAAPPTWLQQQRMAPLYRLLHKHCAELGRMRSPGGWAFAGSLGGGLGGGGLARRSAGGGMCAAGCRPPRLTPPRCISKQCDL